MTILHQLHDQILSEYALLVCCCRQTFISNYSSVFLIVESSGLQPKLLRFADSSEGEEHVQLRMIKKYFFIRIAPNLCNSSV